MLICRSHLTIMDVQFLYSLTDSLLFISVLTELLILFPHSFSFYHSLSKSKEMRSANRHPVDLSIDIV
ncbi:MAG: hypothetical protein CME31_23750 [Gimesia sp.]|uniref:Uncharacterized protein n=1 Tax=Gimesia maris TaxID=122 RepID=A0A3D3REY7_9PLAN|nr:hypothetical protein [Gimesia sp.]HCO27375.1 hypothetical protein [Gimesia maris]